MRHVFIHKGKKKKNSEKRWNENITLDKVIVITTKSKGKVEKIAPKMKKKNPKQLRKDEDRGGGGGWTTTTTKFTFNLNYCKFSLGFCVALICLIENCFAGYACLSNPCIFGVCIDDINR